MNLDPKSLVDDEPAEAEPAADPSPSGIPTSDDFVARVNAMTPGEISPDQILTVIAAINHASTGDPVGTVRLGPNGELAQRINLNGVDQWQITKPTTGEQWFDFAPTLDWQLISGGN